MRPRSVRNQRFMDVCITLSLGIVTALAVKDTVQNQADVRITPDARFGFTETAATFLVGNHRHWRDCSVQVSAHSSVHYEALPLSSWPKTNGRNLLVPRRITGECNMSNTTVADLFNVRSHNPSFFSVKESAACKGPLLDFCIPVNLHFPPPQMVQRIIQRLPEILRYYPDYAEVHAKHIGEIAGVPPDCIVPANGSTEIITRLCHLTRGPILTPRRHQWRRRRIHRSLGESRMERGAQHPCARLTSHAFDRGEQRGYQHHRGELNWGERSLVRVRVHRTDPSLEVRRKERDSRSAPSLRSTRDGLARSPSSAPSLRSG